MVNLKVAPLRPNMPFTDSNGSLTKDAYDFLFTLFQRVGGSLNSLNAVYLADKTWDTPAPIGINVPSTGKFTVLQSTGAFACNGKSPQTSYVSGGAAPTTASTNLVAIDATGNLVGAYGYTTQAQADAIVTKLNAIQAALVANGIMS